MKSDWLLIYGRINCDNCIGIENDVYMYLAVQLMNKLRNRNVSN